MFDVDSYVDLMELQTGILFGTPDEEAVGEVVFMNSEMPF